MAQIRKDERIEARVCRAIHQPTSPPVSRMRAIPSPSEIRSGAKRTILEIKPKGSQKGAQKKRREYEEQEIVKGGESN